MIVSRTSNRKQDVNVRPGVHETGGDFDPQQLPVYTIASPLTMRR